MQIAEINSGELMLRLDGSRHEEIRELPDSRIDHLFFEALDLLPRGPGRPSRMPPAAVKTVCLEIIRRWLSKQRRQP